MDALTTVSDAASQALAAQADVLMRLQIPEKLMWWSERRWLCPSSQFLSRIRGVLVVSISFV
jgi:hypothetical protein